MIIPVLAVLPLIYYSQRIAGFVASVLFGSIILEQKLDLMEAQFQNAEDAKNFYLDLNPFRMEHYEIVERQRIRLGMPSQGTWAHIFIKAEEMPDEMQNWVDDYVLTPQENAQFQDVLKYHQLQRRIGIGKKFAEICEKSKLNPEEISNLCWPESNQFTVDPHWFKMISDRRKANPEFMAALVPVGE